MRLLSLVLFLPLLFSCSSDHDGDVLRRNYVISKTNEVVPEIEETEP